MNFNYKFIDNRVSNINFRENFFGKNSNDNTVSVQVETTVMSSTKKEEENKYLIKFKVDINDKVGNFSFNVEILNRIELNVDESSNIDEVLTDICIPDLLARSRKIIKEITTSMNIQPIDLPPFNEEVNL